MGEGQEGGDDGGHKHWRVHPTPILAFPLNRGKELCVGILTLALSLQRRGDFLHKRERLLMP